MRQLLAVLVALALIAPAAAAEWPVLRNWEATIRFNPPTPEDFVTLKTFGPKWDDMVAGYYAVQAPVDMEAYTGTRAQVWKGITTLEAIDAPSGLAAPEDFQKLFDYGKAFDPAIAAMGQTNAYRYVLLGQTLNAQDIATYSDEELQFCVFVVGCGRRPPRLPPKQPIAPPTKMIVAPLVLGAPTTIPPN
jgi:hypothetical protein